MTLLEQTYLQLRDAGLVKCAEDFSRDYLGKNKNWYAFQTHTGRDFSVAAAVQCLRKIELCLKYEKPCPTIKILLLNLQSKLKKLLSTQHSIAGVC